jgi:hypothetical protein
MRSAFLLLLVACGGDKTTTDTGDTDTDPQTTPTGDTGTVPDTYPATWAGVQQLFTEHCDVCHPSMQDVELREAATSGYPYVIPGDANASYLWQVVSGNSILRMPPNPPLGTGLLPIETVQCVHDWIEAGASFE